MGIPKLIGITALCALAALLWVAFIRRVPEQAASATILTKTYRPPTTYTQQPVGADRGFRIPTAIPIAASYTFELRMDGAADPVRASLNEGQSRHFEVGQRVRVQYVRRGLPPFWQRVRVIDMVPADSR